MPIQHRPYYCFYTVSNIIISYNIIFNGNERATYLSYSSRFEPLWGTPFQPKSLLFLIINIRRNSSGATGWDWTSATWIFSPVLYHLSYSGMVRRLAPSTWLDFFDKAGANHYKSLPASSFFYTGSKDNYKPYGGPGWTWTNNARRRRSYSPLRYQFRSPTHIILKLNLCR